MNRRTLLKLIPGISVFGLIKPTNIVPLPYDYIHIWETGIAPVATGVGFDCHNLYISPEALEDLRNWNIDQIDEITNHCMLVFNEKGGSYV